MEGFEFAPPPKEMFSQTLAWQEGLEQTTTRVHKESCIKLGLRWPRSATVGHSRGWGDGKLFVGQDRCVKPNVLRIDYVDLSTLKCLNRQKLHNTNWCECKVDLAQGRQIIEASAETECQAARFPVNLEEEPDPSKNSTVHWVPKEPSLASWMHLVSRVLREGWKRMKAGCLRIRRS